MVEQEGHENASHSLGSLRHGILLGHDRLYAILDLDEAYHGDMLADFVDNVEHDCLDHVVEVHHDDYCFEGLVDHHDDHSVAVAVDRHDDHHLGLQKQRLQIMLDNAVVIASVIAINWVFTRVLLISFCLCIYHE